jgi:hypothetical protein
MSAISHEKERLEATKDLATGTLKKPPVSSFVETVNSEFPDGRIPNIARIVGRGNQRRPRSATPTVKVDTGLLIVSV